MVKEILWNHPLCQKIDRGKLPRIQLYHHPASRRFDEPKCCQSYVRFFTSLLLSPSNNNTYIILDRYVGFVFICFLMHLVLPSAHSHVKRIWPVCIRFLLPTTIAMNTLTRFFQVCCDPLCCITRCPLYISVPAIERSYQGKPPPKCICALCY